MISSDKPRTNSGERGNVLLVTTLTVSVLLGCLGLAIDGGAVYVQKRKLQNAADAAAMGAAFELQSGASPATIVAAGKADAALNGYDGAAQDVVVTIGNPPLAGSHAGDRAYVEAVIAKTHAVSFMRYLGFNNVPIQARAEARSGGSAGCVYAMDSSGQDDAFLVDGVFNSDCGVYSNSASSRSMNKAGGSVSAPFFRTRGGWAGIFSVMPLRISSPVADPLAALPAPAWGSVNHHYDTAVTADSVLNPGIYHGGLTIGAGIHVTFRPGLYIINGGGINGSGLSAGGPATWLDGTGVTFFFTGDQATVNPPARFVESRTKGPSGFLFGGQGRITFSAPVSGADKGVLFFQDRAKQGGRFDIDGAGVSKLEGILYFPGADFLYRSGAQHEAAYTIVVSKTLRVAGAGPNLRVRADYSSIGGSPFKTTPVLVN